MSAVTESFEVRAKPGKYLTFTLSGERYGIFPTIRPTRRHRRVRVVLIWSEPELARMRTFICPALHWWPRSMHSEKRDVF